MKNLKALRAVLERLALSAEIVQQPETPEDVRDHLEAYLSTADHRLARVQLRVNANQCAIGLGQN